MILGFSLMIMDMKHNLRFQQQATSHKSGPVNFDCFPSQGLMTRFQILSLKQTVKARWKRFSIRRGAMARGSGCTWNPQTWRRFANVDFTYGNGYTLYLGGCENNSMRRPLSIPWTIWRNCIRLFSEPSKIILQVHTVDKHGNPRKLQFHLILSSLSFVIIWFRYCFILNGVRY